MYSNLGVNILWFEEKVDQIFIGFSKITLNVQNQFALRLECKKQKANLIK